jgi:phosphoenolpyruvate carboxylase
MAADLSPELRALVKESTAILGATIRREVGPAAFERVEKVRRRMASLRGSSAERAARELDATFELLARMPTEEKRSFARAYTLMFELANACENAYRTWRLRARQQPDPARPRESYPTGKIFYVLTAHPTEARSPENIEIFHQLQSALVSALERGFDSERPRIEALIAAAWRVRIVRYRKPRVKDEAEHIYSVVLRDENLSLLLDFGEERVPVYLRSWVGGDKDGHPGVDARAMLQSLQLSRDFIRAYAVARAGEAQRLVSLFRGDRSRDRLCALGSRFERELGALRRVRAADGKRLDAADRALRAWLATYRKEVGVLPASLRRLERLFKVFPGLVVPLELREDSAVLLSDPTGKSLAIGKMLRAVAALAAGGDARRYVRGMIISMAGSAKHVRVAMGMVRTLARDVRIRVVPLFEQRDALERSPEILREVFASPGVRKLLRGRWGGFFEVMLGYSDSAKESGVLQSRLAVVEAMRRIDGVCRRARVQPIFFHGSGGSIDRGGGSVSEQMAPWPRSAVSIYKATIQGEMVERSFASPEIAQSRFLQIAHGGRAPASRASAELRVPARAGRASPELRAFAARVAATYSETIGSDRFLRMVERATPYRYLSALKIGSRPSKRGGALSVPALRAIPWVLCWTQTRVLFQTWWGVGSAWREASPAERTALRRDFGGDPLFRSYVHALGFTLAKIELPVWEAHLSRSGLPEDEIRHFRQLFRSEHAATREFFEGVTGREDPLYFRPWLARSIELRGTLIHPLNLLEILAQKERDLPLLRLAVTGIASGMLTTG